VVLALRGTVIRGISGRMNVSTKWYLSNKPVASRKVNYRTYSVHGKFLKRYPSNQGEA